MSLSLDDVHKTLGEKLRIDKILSTYFNHKHNQNPILHVKKFMREVTNLFKLNAPKLIFLVRIILGESIIGLLPMDITVIFCIVYWGASHRSAS